MIPNSKKIYLVQPDLSIRTVLNGVQTDIVDFHPQAKGYSELSFDVDRFINVDGQMIESNGYEDLKPSMYLYLEDIGYFIMEAPEVSYDGNKEIKSVVAYSAEKEFEFKDLRGIKINCGTSDSIEYSYTDDSNKELVDGKYKFAINYVAMYYPENTHLSFLHIILEKMSSKWNIQYVSPQLLPVNNKGKDVDLSKLPAIEIDNENLYAIMTSEVAPRMNCIFIFDYLNFGIRVYHKDELEFETNIFTSFRNLQTQVNVSVDTDSIFTKFTVAGDGDLNFRDYNYGDDTIIDLSYFLGEPYLEEGTITKYNDWIAIKEKYRQQYIDLALEYDELLETKSEKIYRVPSDASAWEKWQNISKEGLDKNLEYYQKYLQTLQISVDDRDISEMYDAQNNYLPKMVNGEVDHEWYEDRLYERVNVYGGYYTYREIVEYIIPYIEMALRNVNVVEDYKETPDVKINENWEMYGLKELQAVRDSFLEQMEALDKYSKAWNEMDEEERKQKRLDYIDDGEGTQYEQLQGRIDYKHYKEQLGDENTEGTILYQIKKLEDEIAVIDARLEELKDITNDYAKLMKYNVTEDILNGITHLPSEIVDERRPSVYDERELLAIETLIRETDYQNSNILVTTIMSVSEKFNEEKNLYDDAADKLFEVAQPQYKFSVSMDNFFRLPEYKDWADEFLPGNTDNIHLGLLKFIRVAIREDYVVKLRVIGYRWNPCEITPDLTLEFSNFIVGRSGRSDLTELLDLGNNAGSKNSIKIGNGSAESTQEYAEAIMELLQNNALFQKSVQNISSGTTGGTDVATVQSIIGDYLGNYQIDVGSATLDDVSDEELAGRIADFEKGYFDQIVANYITTQDIHAETGSFKDLSAMIIQAQQGYFDNLEAKKVTAEAVQTVLLEATRAEIGSLLADDAIIGQLNTFNTTSVSGMFQSGFMQNLIAQNISVGDLAAGNIVLSQNMLITSENGKMIMDGTALQIMGTTESGEDYVGIQLGYDANNNPSLVIRNESNAVILDPNGITENAIADQLIRNNMIKDGTLGKEKLGFSIIEPNAQGGVDITQLYDGQGNLWGVQYASFKNEVTQFMDTMEDVGASVEIHGQQVFVEEQGTISPTSITLRAETKHATIDKWFIDDVEDITHVSADKNEITIPSALIKDKKTITVKVQCEQQNVYDIMTLYRVTDGESAYTIILSSSKGELFKEDDTTSVTCTVYYGSNIVTGKKYYWTITVNNGSEEVMRTEETITNVLENIPVNTANLLVNIQCDVEI